MDTVLTAQALAVEPLTQAAFAPFGDVVEARGIPLAINQGRCYKYCDLTSVSTDRDGHYSVHIFKTSAIRQPYKLDLFERHPLGSQTFMPLEKQRFLVVVAESSGSDEPDLSTLRCFLTNGSQGLLTGPGSGITRCCHWIFHQIFWYWIAADRAIIVMRFPCLSVFITPWRSGL